MQFEGPVPLVSPLLIRWPVGHRNRGRDRLLRQCCATADNDKRCERGEKGTGSFHHCAGSPSFEFVEAISLYGNSLKHLLDAAQRLACPLFVFDQ
jgi:hypothetical protein